MATTTAHKAQWREKSLEQKNKEKRSKSISVFRTKTKLGLWKHFYLREIVERLRTKIVLGNKKDFEHLLYN
jgi:hypothetical protein